MMTSLMNDVALAGSWAWAEVSLLQLRVTLQQFLQLIFFVRLQLVFVRVEGRRDFEHFEKDELEV